MKPFGVIIVLNQQIMSCKLLVQFFCVNSIIGIREKIQLKKWTVGNFVKCTIFEGKRHFGTYSIVDQRRMVTANSSELSLHAYMYLNC